MTTGKQMCETISKWLKEKHCVSIKPDDIWNYSTTGELSLVFDLYSQAIEYQKTVEN